MEIDPSANSSVNPNGENRSDINENVPEPRQSPNNIINNNNPGFNGFVGDVPKAGNLPGATELLSQAMDIYKTRFKTLIGISILPVAVILVASALMASVFYVLRSLNMDMLYSIASFLFTFIFSVLAIAISLWGQIAMIYAVKDRNENIGIKESYARARSKVNSYLWVSIYTALIVFGGFLFFMIPGIIFSIWFGMATYVLIAEDIGGMNALLKSREYVRGHWWEIFSRMLSFVFLLIIVMVIILMSAAMLFGILSLMIKDPAIINMLSEIFGDFVSVIIAPISVVYSFLIYENLKKIKGNFEFVPSQKTKRSYILVTVLGLLSLLIVPAMLAMIIFSSLNSARDKAMDVAVRSDMMQMRNYLEIYYSDNEKYPQSLGDMDMGYLNSSANKYEYKQLKNGEDYELCVKNAGMQNSCVNSYNHTDSSNSMEINNGEAQIAQNDNNGDVNISDAASGRDLKRKDDLTRIALMIYDYKFINGNFPISPAVSKLNAENEIVSAIKLAGGEDLPRDPKDPEYYYGYMSSDGVSFELSARLEDLGDPECDPNIKGICLYKVRH